MLKEQKGITLVALIITIIVMLILAGVSISLVVGEGGVLTQAQDVEPKQMVASAKEAVALATASFVEYFLYVSRMPQRSCHSGRIPYMLKQSSERICCLEFPSNLGVMIPPNCLVEQRNQFHRF